MGAVAAMLFSRKDGEGMYTRPPSQHTIWSITRGASVTFSDHPSAQGGLGEEGRGRSAPVSRKGSNSKAGESG